jgi:hypothetical protein
LGNKTHKGLKRKRLVAGNEKGEVIAAITVSSISQRRDRKRRQEILDIVKEIIQAEGFYLIRDWKASKRPALRRAGKE